MSRFRNVMFLVAVLAGAITLGAPTQADAAFKLRVTAAVDGVFGNGNDISFTWTDQVFVGPSPDNNPIAGLVSSSSGFPVGGFLVSVDGTSRPFGTNDATHANTHLHAITVANIGSSADLVRIELTDTGFSLTSAGGTAGISSTIGGTANVSPLPGSSITNARQIVQFQVGVGPAAEAATEFGTAPTFFLTNAPPPLGPGAFSNTSNGTFAYNGETFSLTEFVELSLTASSVVSFDYDSVVSTPAPPGLALLCAGALTLMGYRIRRKKVAA
jgi:hypothetical protein